MRRLLAKEAIERIGQLYAIESEIRGTAGEPVLYY